MWLGTPHRQFILGAGPLLAALVAWPGISAAAALHVRDSVPAADATVPGHYEEYFRYY